MIKSKIDIYVAQTVKSKRLENHLTQADISYELDVSIGFIGQVESTKLPAHYNVKHLNDLAKILKCSPQDFLPKRPL